ncbi:MAG: DUF4258 domain-containing protein [Anaerolineales bacterium]
MGKLNILISDHARQQMNERGASEDEVVAAIRLGYQSLLEKTEHFTVRIFNLMVSGGVGTTP